MQQIVLNVVNNIDLYEQEALKLIRQQERDSVMLVK